MQPSQQSPSPNPPYTPARQDGEASTRRPIASYPNYPEAQRAVDFLSDRGFPVQRLAIVTEGLRLYEQVTGRRNWAYAIGQGALQGALIGLSFGLLLAVLNIAEPLVPLGGMLFSGVVYGSVFGAVLGAVTYGLSGGQRDFTSMSLLRADRYELVCDADIAPQAESLLGQMR